MINSTMCHKRAKCGVLQIGDKKIFTYEGINLVGRNKEAVVILKDPIASQHHAIITIINDCHYVSDCKSTNGTKLDHVSLVPFQMYQIEDNNEIEFTPKYIGKYKKLNTNASQLSTPLTSQNASQMTQSEEGFYDHTTQVQKPDDVFNDDLDADLSKIIVDTQHLNSTNHEDKITKKSEVEVLSEEEATVHAVVDIHEAETQAFDIQPCSSKHSEDTVNITVPTIYEAATQVESDFTSIVSAFADMPDFTQNIQAKSTKALERNDNLTKSADNNTSATNSADFIDTQSAVDSMDSMQVVEVEVVATCAEDLNKTDRQEEGPHSTHSDLACESDNVNIANLSTQTVDPDAESQFSKVDANEVNTESSLNLQLSMTQNPGVAEDADDASNDSIDMLLNFDASALQMINMPQETDKKKQSEDIISDPDSEDFSFNKSKNTSLNPGSSSTLRKSRFILSDSEESDTEDKVGQTSKETNARATLSATIINDSLADCEDSYVQRKSIVDVSLDCIPATQDATFSPGMQDSFKLGLSVVEEVSAISKVQLDITEDSVINDTFDGESQPQSSRLLKGLVTEQEDDLFDGESEEIECAVGAIEAVPVDANYSAIVDFLAPTQQVLAPDHRTEKKLDDDDDFLAPTQPVCRRTRSGRISSGMNSSDVIAGTQDDCDYDVATQRVTKDSEFASPVKVQGKVTFSPKVQTLGLDDDSELFCMPTQSALGFMKSKKEAMRKSGGKCNDTQSDDFDFEAATQQVGGDVEKEAVEDDLAADTQVLDIPTKEQEDVDLEADTETFEPIKERKGASLQETDVELSKENDEIVETNKELSWTEMAVTQVDDFDAPTQAIIANDVDVETDRRDLEYTEAETQEMDALNPEPIAPKVPQVESQLEVMFATQNISLPVVDNSRPSNPMASMLETTTQDVIESLTSAGSGIKRLSDQSEDAINTKRAKTTPKPKTTHKKIVETPKPRVSRSNTPKLSTLKSELNTNQSTSKDNPMLDYLQKAETLVDDEDLRVSSKLSMIKKQVKMVPPDDNSLSNDALEIECLADTIPMKVLEVPKKVIEETILIDLSLNMNTLKRTKKRLMDLDSICSMPSPEPVSDTNANKSDVDDKKDTTNNNKSKRTTKGKESAASKRRTEAKASAPARKTRKTRGSKEETNDKPTETETRTLRTSSRAKKTVNYGDSKPKSKSSKKSSDESGESEDEKTDKPDKSVVPLIIHVPDKQDKFVLADKDDLNRKKPRKNSTTVEKPKRAGRPSVSKTVEAQAVLTPERNKRITKPKVIFTMLDDPQLQKLVRSLGGSVVDTLEKSTVLVTAKVQRTLKLLGAIANSIPICSPEWLQQCKKANAFLDPWDYLINDTQAEEQWNFCIKESLQKSKNGKIFAGYQFLILVTLSADVIKGAIDSNGGKVVSRKPSSGHFIVVASPTQKSKYETYLKNKVKVVSSEAILIGILRQKIVFDEHLLS